MANKRHLNKLHEGVKAWNQWRAEEPETAPDLRKADLHEMLLTEIDFERTFLDGANLRNAKLCSASLKSASLYQTNLSEARLRHAWLHGTYFNKTILQQTNFHNASLLETMFLNVDLSESFNLATVFHLGPSTVGTDTFQRSRGNIPDIFLRGTGVSEQLLTCLHSSGRVPFDYCTCFISHSSYDRHFVDILNGDLRKEGIFCWYAPENLQAGEKFSVSIMEAVQSREKVLVVLSKHSLKSNWVRQEVMLALQKEGKGKKEVLLPICLDSAILNSTLDWAVAIRKRRNIRNFENWQQPPRYQKLLKDLFNDLRKE